MGAALSFNLFLMNRQVLRQKLKDLTANPGKRPILLERTPITTNVALPAFFSVQAILQLTMAPEEISPGVSGVVTFLSASCLAMTWKYRPKMYKWSLAIHSCNVIMYSILCGRSLVYQASDAAINASKS